jgi:hypothetical protein
MTTIAAGRLSETLQTLVDARLDTIDRMLLGRVNRHDRLAIVREVESQIFDLLHGRDSGSLDRDDVLAVLARLDPPEAYLPDESSGEFAPPRLAIPSRALSPARDDRKQHLATVSGVLGIIAVGIVLLTFILIFSGALDGSSALAYIVIFGSTGSTGVLSLLAVINATRVRLRGAWAIVGLVTGILGLLATLLGLAEILAG